MDHGGTGRDAHVELSELGFHDHGRGARTAWHHISNGVLLQKMVTLPAVCRDADGMFPTMFEVLRMQMPSSHIAIFHDWPGFADLVEKHAPNVMQHERGADRTTKAAIRLLERESSRADVRASG